ncbi:family 78 glycoside hydrolase catalytic domain [Alloscardovia venturai]|uniref:alpha-L-rhamnosidase n=1 Tax=Alloscardovia venturai TaxID=1769421 RepID=A0ABW2Y376_9BIFI
MAEITRFTVENVESGCVTDEEHPCFAFVVTSEVEGDAVASATISINDQIIDATEQIAVRYMGPALEPFTSYAAELLVTLTSGATATAQTSFETGRLSTPWQAQWITDGDYKFTEKKVSPRPMVFRRVLNLDAAKAVKSARLYATALGMYDVTINGDKISDYYFAPGFTSYKTNLQYQAYDVTEQLAASHNSTLVATVTGGWAVGSFVFTRVNRVTAPRQAFLAELRVQYTDGTTEIIATDSNWQVTLDSPVKTADLYDGEVFDARDTFTADAVSTISGKSVAWRTAALENVRIHPTITADYSARVKVHEVFTPVSCNRLSSGELIYDFGQNFAGVVRLHLKNAHNGQTIMVKHAEIINNDGSLNTTFLRTAQATLVYTATEGGQTYQPQFTYMGFRYISVSGVSAEDVEVEGVALYSDMKQIGHFSSSNPQINRLQKNIEWGSKSNLMDIPTDCPQRDERMGWTGDIAVFSPTACFNFDMSRFLNKWLKDVKAEQTHGGGIPNTVPVQGYGFPATMPKMAIDWWGDACVLVPWAEYQARGDKQILRDMYDTMKKYVKACLFWAHLWGTGDKRYIWDTPSVLHFGDWVAPDVPQMSQWQSRSKWTATASLNNTSRTLARIAEILGETEDAKKYNQLADRVAQAYINVFTDGRGKLKNEFQTAYVLPLYLGMFPENQRAAATENFVRLVEKNDYKIGTGFPGTPYILFALADNGRADVAYKMLLNDACPSWLYEVKQGATTIWERWDGLDENGECPIGDDGTDIMISYNHYASGAVGAFLYKRVAGLEQTSAGYKTFRVAPIIGGGLTSAETNVQTPYGVAASSWTFDEETKQFALTVTVPVGTSAEVILPNGEKYTVQSGTHTYTTTLHPEITSENNETRANEEVRA